MKTVEATGKTVEDAIQKALDELKIEKRNAEINILSEPTPGFFGIIGSREAKVRVSIKSSPEEFIPSFLAGLLELMKIRADIHYKESRENNRYYQIKGKNLGTLIGKRGQTLNSIQYLLNIAYHRNFNTRERIVLDVENYRKRRERTLKRLALSMADKATRLGKRVVMEPMTPQERRIIHLTLADNNKIETYSTGEDPNRKVVISPKN